VTKKPHYVGYQAKSWNDILKHDLFRNEEQCMERDYPWILSVEERTRFTGAKQADLADETLHKLYQIYVSRSSTLFTPEPILL
jgi:hypothetical protein